MSGRRPKFAMAESGRRCADAGGARRTALGISIPTDPRRNPASRSSAKPFHRFPHPRSLAVARRRPQPETSDYSPSGARTAAKPSCENTASSASSRLHLISRSRRPKGTPILLLSLAGAVLQRWWRPRSVSRWRGFCAPDFGVKSVSRALVHLPLVLPPVVTGYLLLLTFGRRGPCWRWLADHLGIVSAFSWTRCGVPAVL